MLNIKYTCKQNHISDILHKLLYNKCKPFQISFMSENIVIACPQCGAKNRVPTDKFSHNPKCGSCHQSLNVGEPSELSYQSLHKFIVNNDPLVIIDFWAFVSCFEHIRVMSES